MMAKGHISIRNFFDNKANIPISIFYTGLFFIPTFAISTFAGSISGAISGLMSNRYTKNLFSDKELNVLEKCGLFVIRRFFSTVEGAVTGALLGVKDALIMIASPWKRLFFANTAKKQIEKKPSVTTTSPSYQKVIEELEVNTSVDNEWDDKDIVKPNQSESGLDDSFCLEGVGMICGCLPDSKRIVDTGLASASPSQVSAIDTFNDEGKEGDGKSFDSRHLKEHLSKHMPEGWTSTCKK